MVRTLVLLLLWKNHLQPHRNPGTKERTLIPDWFVREGTTPQITTSRHQPKVICVLAATESPMLRLEWGQDTELESLKVTWTAVEMRRNEAVSFMYGPCFIVSPSPLQKGIALSDFKA